MPLLHKKPFEPKQFVKDQSTTPNQEVFYLKLTNEIFDSHDDYFDRIILCNSLVWSCALTGKANMTFQEALTCERTSARALDTISKPLRKAIFYLITLTRRGKVLDICDDIFSFTREHYFTGEVVKAVIGNMWCRSTVLRIILPTSQEIEEYKRDQIEKGEIDNNDYLKDDSWGPPPDLFKYEVCEVDPDNPEVDEVFVLESVDVKRDKTILTREKCRSLVKMNTYFDEKAGYWKVNETVAKYYDLPKVRFEHIFVGVPPNFEETLATAKPPTKKPISNHNSSSTTLSGDKKRKSGQDIGSSKNKKLKIDKKGNVIKRKSSSKGASPAQQLSPSEVKQREQVKKLEEREKAKANKKLIADFKKLWFKPKEDLMVEDLKDLPEPEPINCKIPNNLFGDFMMILEYANCYASTIKIRDYFPSGLTFETFEKILFSNEIAGPFSDLLQLLLKTIFRFQVDEEYESIIEVDPHNEYHIDTMVDMSLACITRQNNNVYNWAKLNQNTSLNRLTLDHFTLNEILRQHLLASGANSSSEESRWRYQQRGGYTAADDPGFELILTTDIINTLTHGNVFELNIADRIKLITCLVNQILTYTSVRELMEENFENFKKARNAAKLAQAAERRAEVEDTLWRQRLKSERAIPDLSVPIPKSVKDGEAAAVPPKGDMTDEQIEAELRKRDKESERRKASFQAKFNELQYNTNKYEKKLGIHPIGKDRSFRRYWIFATIPGIFVENDDEHIGECQGPTPFLGEVDVNDINFVNSHYEKLKQQEDDNLNNKENSAKVPLSVSKGSTKPALTQGPLPLQICNGNSKTCRIHSKLNLAAPKWSFYSNESQLNELLNTLSSRGVRERELANFLNDEKDGLIRLLAKCPKYKLNFKYPSEPSLVGERRSNRIKNAIDPNLNFAVGTSINKISELQFRDLILETEDKIFLGGLGSLKVGDRLEWRSAIENRKYDAMVESLSWGHGNSFSLCTSDLPTLALRSPEANFRLVVRDLACAVLQLEQSLEAKFLRKPLGVDKEEPDKKKNHQKKTSLELSEIKAALGPSQLEKWEASLMRCVNFSQLFIHLFTLDNSVEWNRSVLNARCRICRRKGDAENMLLCDKCNKGHHLYCLKPPIAEIPKGDWFCLDCRPVEKLSPRNPVQKKYFVKEDEEDEEEEEEEEEEETSQTSIVEVCEVCKFGGEVICCDGCPSVYHLFCLNPPKTRVPRGEWLCEQCTHPKKRNSRGRTVPKKKTRRQISNSSSNSTTDTPSVTSEEEEQEEEMEVSDSEEEESATLRSNSVSQEEGFESENSGI